MAIPVLILGESGTGKSASLRNFAPEEVSIFNVASKPLPFRKQLPTKNTADYNEIMRLMAQSSKKAFVIDDSQYLLCFEAFSKAKEAGYGKYTDMALNFYNLVKFVIDRMPNDRIVYFLHHTEQDTNTGKVKAKTLGKMLDNQLTVEGLFSIVLMTQVTNKAYEFVTQSDGYTTCKSPMEMFERTIPNDLKLVDVIIRNYYGMDNKEQQTAEEPKTTSKVTVKKGDKINA